MRVVGMFAAVVMITYACLLLVSAYQARQASRLVSEFRSITIGDTEESIRPILNRYRAYRWDHALLESREDYSYGISSSAWNLLDVKSLLLKGERHPFREKLASSGTRRRLGFPLWLIDCSVGIKDHKVVVVQTGAMVEGRKRWLATSVRLAEQPREVQSNYLANIEPDTKFASSGILEMINGGGSIWEFWIKSSSPTVQREMVYDVDFSCLRSIQRCKSMCELMPRAEQFFKTNPALAGNEHWTASCANDEYQYNWR